MSTLEHLGPDPDCVPVLRFLGMNLERVNKDRSAELSLPEGSILVNQMQYTVEVFMKFEPSLQLKTSRQSGELGDTTQTYPKAARRRRQAEFLDALHALMQDDVVEIDTAQKSPKLHYNSAQNVINLPAIVGCLNWIAWRTRADIAWATSRAASLTIHTLGYALRLVPIPPETKHKLWVMGDASFAPTGRRVSKTNCISWNHL